MRYLKIVMLLLAVTVGTQACIIPMRPASPEGERPYPHGRPLGLLRLSGAGEC